MAYAVAPGDLDHRMRDQDVGGHLGHPASALEPEQWLAKHRIDPAEVA
ncbi:hypothetical protein ACIA8R_17825 [Nonomuraea sp. NPDC051191]